MRQQFDEHELRNLLANGHGIEVRLWIVNDGVFEGIVFDNYHPTHEQFKTLISDPDGEE